MQDFESQKKIFYVHHDMKNECNLFSLSCPPPPQLFCSFEGFIHVTGESVICPQLPLVYKVGPKCSEYSSNPSINKVKPLDIVAKRQLFYLIKHLINIRGFEVVFKSYKKGHSYQYTIARPLEQQNIKLLGDKTLPCLLEFVFKLNLYS